MQDNDQQEMRRPAFGTRQLQRAFTLVELMAVLVVMLVLMGLAVPLFNKLAVGSGVDAGARIVSAQLRLARQHAITKRKKIAVIMPGPNATTVDPKYRYSCLRPAIVTGSGGAYTFEEWVENAEWTFLPLNATIMEADNDIGIKDDTTYTKLPQESHLGADNKGVFTTVSGTVAPKLDLTKIGAPTSGASNIRAVVFGPTGKTLGYTPAWVTIGDSTFDGSSWIVREAATLAKNKSCSNQLSIVLDTYTGRAVMKQPQEY